MKNLMKNPQLFQKLFRQGPENRRKNPGTKTKGKPMNMMCAPATKSPSWDLTNLLVKVLRIHAGTRQICIIYHII